MSHRLLSQKVVRRGLVALEQAAAHHPVDIQTPQNARRDVGLSVVQVNATYSWFSSRPQAFLTNIFSAKVCAEVGGGALTTDLFFHGTNRACTLGDRRTEDALCSKRECSLCAIIRNSFDVSKTGM